MTKTPEVKEETPELISREEYIEDIKKLVDFIKPYVVKAIDKTKEIYGKIKAKFQK